MSRFSVSNVRVAKGLIFRKSGILKFPDMDQGIAKTRNIAVANDKDVVTGTNKPVILFVVNNYF